jgi:hypothetical protein
MRKGKELNGTHDFEEEEEEDDDDDPDLINMPLKSKRPHACQNEIVDRWKSSGTSQFHSHIVGKARMAPNTNTEATKPSIPSISSANSSNTTPSKFKAS